MTDRMYDRRYESRIPAVVSAAWAARPQTHLLSSSSALGLGQSSHLVCQLASSASTRPVSLERRPKIRAYSLGLTPAATQSIAARQQTPLRVIAACPASAGCRAEYIQRRHIARGVSDRRAKSPAEAIENELGIAVAWDVC